MPSAEQIKLLFGEFPIPLGLSAVLFGLAWLAARKSERQFDAETRTGKLDVWALAVGYAAGHQAIDGLSGLPPKDALDWLPIGAMAIAILTTAAAALRLPKAVTATVVAAVSVATLAATLNGFQSYRDAYPLNDRLLVLGAILLAMLAGAIALCEFARRLSLADFFLLTGLAGTIATGVLFNGFNTAKIAQILGLTLAVGGAGLVIGLATRIRHVSPAFAATWLLIWFTLACNSYYANYELPPLSGLVLLLVTPGAIGIGLLCFDCEDRPMQCRAAVYSLTLATALFAFALSTPLGVDEEDEEDPYADWGDWGGG